MIGVDVCPFRVFLGGVGVAREAVGWCDDDTNPKRRDRKDLHVEIITVEVTVQKSTQRVARCPTWARVDCYAVKL